MIVCTQLTFDLFLRLRSNYRLGIHPYVFCHTSRNNISMGRIMYSILPSKVKISVFFPMGLPTNSPAIALSVEKEKWKIMGQISSSSLIPVQTIHLPTVHERKKITGPITAAAWFRYTRYIHPFSKCVTSFNLLGLTVPEKSVTKNFNVWKLERKIKGRISSSSLTPVYTIHLPTVHMCTKFQPSRPHSSWEKIDEKFEC